MMEKMYGPNATDPDLGSVGGDDDDGPLLRLIGKYGDQALDLLDRVDALKKRFRR